MLLLLIQYNKEGKKTNTNILMSLFVVIKNGTLEMCNLILINFKHFFLFFSIFHSLNRYLIIRQIAIKSYMKREEFVNFSTHTLAHPTENICSISLLSFRFCSNNMASSNNSDDDDRKKFAREQHRDTITIPIGVAFSHLFKTESRLEFSEGGGCVHEFFPF